MIKDKEGLYHAFYTGHNDTYEPKEAVMHATSMDLDNWTKIPEDTVYAGETYSQDDFRDPYVLYVAEEQQYWMLISTRSGSDQWPDRLFHYWERTGESLEFIQIYNVKM